MRSSTNVFRPSEGNQSRGKSAGAVLAARARAAGIMSLALMGCLTAPAYAATVTETFNSSAGAFTTQVRNGVGGNSIAFSNTDSTGTGGGTSGAGEMGGTFARTAEGTPTYVAASLGGSLTRDDNLSLSGRFILTANNSMDGGICVGYVNTSSDSPFGFGDAGVTGFQIVEPNPGPSARARLISRGQDIGGSAQSGIEFNTEYSFNLTYNPVTRELGGTVGPLTFPATATGLAAGETFNAFALLSGTAGSSNAGQTATAFFDDLTYAVVPEPASASALLLAGAVATLRRRRV